MMSKLKYRLASSDREIRFCCPFCDRVDKEPDTKFHLYVSIFTGDWLCFRCGAKGRNLRGLPEDYKNIVIDEAAKRGIIISPTIPTPVRTTREVEVPEGLIEIHNSEVHKFPAFQYFVKRMAAHLESYSSVLKLLNKIPDGYVYIMKRKPNSLFIMSRNAKGFVDFYTERVTNDSTLKYKNPSTVKTLFKIGLWDSEREKVPVAFLVEGAFDALVLFIKYRIPTFALSGKTITRNQISELRNIIEENGELIIALDKDAQREACEMRRKIESSMKVGKIYRAIPTAGDPADSKGNFEAIIGPDEDSECLLMM